MPHYTMKFSKLLLAAASAAALAGSAQAISIFGLGTDNNLYRFDSATPGSLTTIGTGFSSTIDIDFRGSNGLLYGITGSGSASTINTTTGVATVAVTPATALSNTVSAFDFNPVADRMRVLVGGTSINNYRITPAIGGAVTPDGNFVVPGGFEILGFGYTNPTGGTTTSLYSVVSNSTLYLHTGGPDFNGLTPVGTGLGITLGTQVGFDIGPDGVGYLTNGSSLYSVNLTSGTASLLGTAPVALRDIAVVPEPSVAALGAIAALGLLRRRR
jgi:hypothetical protein